MTDKPDLDFKTKEEFRDVCGYLAGRLNHLNRVAMGETGFAAEMAKLLSRAGRTFDENYDDPTTRTAFGDGYTAGTLGRHDRAVALHALMYPAKK